MPRVRRNETRYEMSEEQDQDSRRVFWTDCPQCGNTWVTKAVLTPGKCPVCGGKPKVQKAV